VSYYCPVTSDRVNNIDCCRCKEYEKREKDWEEKVAALERELAEHKVKYSLLQEQMRLVQAVRDNEDEVKKKIQSSPKCNLKVRKTS
jgi:hypothetical protein